MNAVLRSVCSSIDSLTTSKTKKHDLGYKMLLFNVERKLDCTTPFTALVT